MMKTRSLILVAILAGVMAPPAAPTTLVRLSLKQLVQASTHIVRGRVVAQESLWNPEHTQIVTLTTLAVGEALKGGAPSTLVIEQPGGTIGNIRSRVAGTVRFFPQAEYLLFLEPAASNPSRFLIVGMAQGAYRVYRDAGTNEERIIRPFLDLLNGARSAGSGLGVSSQTVPLSQFRAQVSSAMAAEIVFPRGTAIPLTIQAVEPRGAGRLRVLGRTASTVYPDAATVIPPGSPVEGTAQLVMGVWRIHWTELSIRGTRVAISANNEEPRGMRLQGRGLTVNLR